MLQIHHNRTSAKFNVIKSFLLIILYSSLMPTCLLKTKMVHGKHFVIHVPIKIRTHHHTHTVYTQVHGMGKGGGSSSYGGGGGGGGANKQTIYKIMGYSTHHSGLAAGSGGNSAGAGVAKTHYHRYNGHSHGYRHNRGDSRENNYDDFIDCDTNEIQPSGGGGDMIFNHFSRQDEENYPDIQEEIDEEMGDDWE